MESWILALPLLVILLLATAIILACFRKWKVATGCFLASLALNWYGEFFALHLFAGMFSSENPDDIKVMTFNINGPGANFYERMDGVVKLIQDEDPDVLFLCEISTPYKHYDEQLDSILKQQHPYSSFKDKTQWGNVFYSKFPIDTVEIVGITIGNSQPLVTIDINGSKIAFLGCHLSSNNYMDSKTRLDVDSVENKNEAKQYIKTIKKGYKSRRQDVDSIKLRLSDVDLAHSIVLGDMNDVGGSYAMRTVESLGLKDAWWNAGFGLGGTRSTVGLPFRIDHVLYGDNINVGSVKVIKSEALSDHDALVTCIYVKDNNH